MSGLQTYTKIGLLSCFFQKVGSSIDTDTRLDGWLYNELPFNSCILLCCVGFATVVQCVPVDKHAEVVLQSVAMVNGAAGNISDL